MTDTSSGRRAEEAAGSRGGEGSGDEPSVEQLKAEIARLRERVAELEAASRRRSPGEAGGAHRAPMSASHQQLLTLVNNAPNIIFLKDTNRRFCFVNQRFSTSGNKSPEEFIGLDETNIFPPDVAAALLADEERIIASGQPLEREEELPTPAGLRWLHSIKFPIYDLDGTFLGIGGIVTDATERRRLEEERLALKEQIIATQKDALRERSTPLHPLAEGVLAMPIVGTVDSVRAGDILETLLKGICERGAHTAILDITGVREVDTQTANALVGAARAARMLGARVVLTGVTPAVAQTFVALEASLEDTTILATLASGIAHALGRRGAGRRSRAG